ncbi:hypothetical protein HELRODRAFT_177051 [Helobdella robusta]|uniref:NLGase n=1 Tax=Helobdella robusta TaxID=6412 RepID=T1FB65_HELRO|nr:hypothetical protein HELRODRAFT_177051 [Helobdella robusta]ESN98572.1 hypothetical protein HELRODRAFT_177051 [Helobdella robusta]
MAHSNMVDSPNLFLSNYESLEQERPWLSTEPLPKIAGLPDYGYRLGFDYVHTKKCRPFKRPRLKHVYKHVGFFFRYTKHWYRQRRRGKRLFIDNFNMVDWKPIYGAPIGGIGGGTIGRGSKGEFCRFQMRPGIYNYDVVHADQFILTLRQDNKTVYQNVLSPNRPPKNVLKSWKWDFPKENGVYHALYPFSWTVYNIEEFGVRLICKQTSPFLPKEYKDSSLPCAIFDWSIENLSEKPIQASITFTFKNGQGGPEDKNGGDSNTVSRMLYFDPNSDGSILWDYLWQEGGLNKDKEIGTSQTTNKGEELAVAVCISTNQEPGTVRNSQFCLSWYMPKICFAKRDIVYERRYTTFFHSLEQIVGHSFKSYPDWTTNIEKWQWEVLRCHEYRMYNTYDVHHYASFALLMLWPNLQLSLQHDFVNEPWNQVNAYFLLPTHEWKDLNVKFVLQVYRDYLLMYKCLRWDVDDDGIIDNAGFADQTYDAWNMTGASSYCGGMWLAAVKMFTLMAHILDQSVDREFFGDILRKGIQSFDRKLWNGMYYDFDSSTSGHHDSCMADQLAGHWFLKASLIDDDDIFPSRKTTSALLSTLELNVLPHFNGRMGAVNGARPDGEVDTTSLQSEEFWVGVNYGLAASMIQDGLVEEGWRTAYGAYSTCYDRYGLAFQTPEAYYLDGQFRSLGYMRPLAIWAIQLALEYYQRALLR